jgi:HSP20 family molecular chaperone IbpA
MQKLVVSFLLFLSANSLAFYDFSKLNYYLDKSLDDLSANLDEKNFSYNNSMNYFDSKNNTYVIKIHTTLAKEDLDIKTHKRYILITGKNDTTKFNQTMSLPKDADITQIVASFAEQVLTIKIPRTSQQQEEFNTIQIK